MINRRCPAMQRTQPVGVHDRLPAARTIRSRRLTSCQLRHQHMLAPELLKNASAGVARSEAHATSRRLPTPGQGAGLARLVAGGPAVTAASH